MSPRASSYQPYLIGNQRTGLILNLEPWLLPADGYKTLENVYLFQGALNKRRGYEEFGKLVYRIEDEVIGVGDGSEDEFAGTLVHFPLQSVNLTITDGVEIFTDADGDGDLVGDQGGTGTIDYTTGDFTLIFNTPVLNLTDILATYEYFPGDPCMGLWNYDSVGGVEVLLGFTTVRMNTWDSTNMVWEDIEATDFFTGSDKNFVWLSNWRGKAYISNNIDRLMEYDGSNLTELLIDTDGDTNNDVTTCRYSFPYKDRLVILSTEEGGNSHKSRARWSKVGTTDFSNDGYVDAPTHEWIIAAEFLSDELIVWFDRSIWALRYTGNERLPFRWVRIVGQEGAVAPLSLIAMNDEQIGFGITSIVGFDGRNAYELSERLGNFTLDLNQVAIEYSYAAIDEERKQIWISHASFAAALPDRIMVCNYDDNSWATYLLSMHCFGYYSDEIDPVWDDIDLTWDEMDRLWDERSAQAGFPVLLGGDYTGTVWKLNTGGNDNGAAISSTIETGDLNPFANKGSGVRLGWVDFLVDRDAAVSLDVSFYVDHESIAAVEKTISLAGDAGDEAGTKVIVRVYADLSGQFIRMKITGDGANQTYRIHAVIPYFKPGGNLR